MSPVRSSRSMLLAGLFALALLPVGCAELINTSDRDHARGVVAYNEGRYADAAGDFRAALRQDPRSYQSHYYLGLCALQLGNYNQSIAAFRSCLETRNVTFAGEDDTATALKAMDGIAVSVVKSDEGDLEVNKLEQGARNAKGAMAAREFYILARVYDHRRLPDMAMDYYNRACLADNQNFFFLKEYGLFLERLNQNARAEQTLRQAYALKPDDKDVAAALARLGVVPGPSLLKKDDLAKPPVPRGPLPEIDMGKAFGGKSNTPTPGSTPAPNPGPNTASTPRD